LLLLPALARAERALVLPLRSEVALSSTQVAQIKAALDNALREQGVEPLESAHVDPCGDQQCVATRIAQSMAQHAVELAFWRASDGRISGVSASVLLTAGERFGEGAPVASDAELFAAINSATRGAYARLRRGAGPWLQLDGTPHGAEIAVNGQPVGALPQRVKVRGGLHRVRVSQIGFEPFEHAVTVPRNIDAQKRLTIELRPALAPADASATQPRAVRPSAINYVLGGAGIAAAVLLGVGPLRSLAQDGECGRTEANVCTGVVDFGAAQGIQLAAATLLLGAGITVSLWAPL
jgi:hypothetical protein